MGGAGNAAAVLEIVDRIIAGERWYDFFLDFDFLFGFYKAAGYRKTARKKRIKADSRRVNPERYDARRRFGMSKMDCAAAWLLYIEPVPPEKRVPFVAEFVGSFLKSHPPDIHNLVHVPMMRLEVEAVIISLVQKIHDRRSKLELSQGLALFDRGFSVFNKCVGGLGGNIACLRKQIQSY